MKSFLPILSAVVFAFFLPGCEGLETSSLSNSGSATGSNEKLTQHDAALRFLTAYVRLDRQLALKYASYEAVSKLNWSRSHGSNIPYYNDKMIMYFNGGWARVFFQEANGSYRVSDLEVHSSR